MSIQQKPHVNGNYSFENTPLIGEYDERNGGRAPGMHR